MIKQSIDFFKIFKALSNCQLLIQHEGCSQQSFIKLDEAAEQYNRALSFHLRKTT